MRTHIAMKTWLIWRGNETIGSIRAVGFEVGQVFEANVANDVEVLRVVRKDDAKRMIEVQ